MGREGGREGGSDGGGNRAKPGNQLVINIHKSERRMYLFI